MSENQKTIKKEATVQGVGLHTGEKVTLTICPADVNTGYRFQRIDVEKEPIIKADVDHVVGTDRGTTLEQHGAKVHTVEHLLSAIYALGIDNALIKIDGPEVPIMDGSAMPFVEAIEAAGIEEQNALKDYIELDENIKWEDAERGIEMLAVPDDEFRVTVMVDYNSPALGTQHAMMYNIREFKAQIAQNRTFCFLKELEHLAKNDLIKGGDLDNAIVLVEREDVSQEELNRLAKMLGKENLSIEIKGIGALNNTELRNRNEPARHKLLDIVGDLALVGKPIKAHILAARPGHSGNVRFGKILKEVLKRKEKGYKHFNVTKEPLYDINTIENMLPHRYPFLLVDKIMEMDDQGVVGVKQVTKNEPFFPGHFPGNPVMPGVLQIEAMAQVGGIFALSTVDEPEKWMTYFLKIDDVKFKKKVMPGDTLVMELKLQRPIRRGLVHMKGTAYVNGEVVSTSDMLAQIVKEKD